MGSIICICFLVLNVNKTNLNLMNDKSKFSAIGTISHKYDITIKLTVEIIILKINRNNERKKGLSKNTDHLNNLSVLLRRENFKTISTFILNQFLVVVFIFLFLLN